MSANRTPGRSSQRSSSRPTNRRTRVGASFLSSSKRRRRRSSKAGALLSIPSYWVEAGMVILLLAFISPTFLAEIVSKIPVTESGTPQDVAPLPYHAISPNNLPSSSPASLNFPHSAQLPGVSTSNAWYTTSQY